MLSFPEHPCHSGIDTTIDRRSAYEQEREANVLENQAMLRSLGLLPIIPVPSAAEQRHMNKVKVKKSINAVPAVRGSTRLKSVVRPDYVSCEHDSDVSCEHGSDSERSSDAEVHVG